jgi:peptide/nickel transport system permease protein
LRTSRRRLGRTVLASSARFVATLLLISTLIFALPRALPGDPLGALLGQDTAVNPEIRTRFLADYGLDRPLAEQYVSYLARLARGDLGFSITGGPVGPLIVDRLPWTLLLVGTSVTMSAVISFRAGVASAWHRGRRGRNKLLVFMTGIEAVPDFALAPVILILFGLVIPLFPLSGGSTAFATYTNPVAALGDVVVHLVLPATALTLSLVGAKFLLLRNSVTSALGQDFMVLARAEGLSEPIQRRHAGRNALLPFLTLIAAELGLAVRGAVIVETVFGYPGMASLILPSAQNLDYPLLEACFLVLAGFVLTANLVIDIVYGLLDPRVGLE